MRRITKTQLRRAFFEGIENPLWVKPLADAGAFRNPPEPVITRDGYIRDTYWPEAEYLSKVALQVPQQVVDVLLTLDGTNNSWVRRVVFEIGTKIPADEAARLQPLIKSWASSGFGWRTDPRDIVGLIVNLLEDGQAEVGKWLADLVFKPSGVKGRRKPDLVLDDYWYEEGLPKVIAVLGAADLTVVLPWLVAYERYNKHLTGESDLTYFSRESIRRRGAFHDAVEQVLIDAVREVAVRAMVGDAPAASALLLGSGMILARKIALFSLGEAIRQSSDDKERLVGLLAVAGQLLLDDESSDDSCRIDYADLARAVAQAFGEPLEPLTGFIERGPRVDSDRLREWMHRDGADEKEVDERIREYTDRWKHRWLSAIGIEAIPAQLKTKLEELDHRFGAIDAPREPTNQMAMWTGPNSPISQDEMAAMSPVELIAHLESWQDSGNGWGPEPSHEGQGRELTALITTNPKAVAGVDNLVERLRPTYARAILRGWEAALKADTELDWRQVADLVQGVLTHSDESAFPVEGGQFNDDVDVRGAKQAAVGLLEELAKGRDAFSVPDDVMSRFAELLLTPADDEAAWLEYIAYEGDSGTDPLTISLNWQWPIRVRGLVYLMSRGTGTSWYGAARSALERELERGDTRGASRAVLGEGIGRLLATDPEWLKSKVALWFGNEGGISVEQQIALTTAIAIHYYHPKMYELLSPPMLAAIELAEPIAAGWRTDSDPLQRIGEWAIDALIRGHRTFEDPVVAAFFASAPAKVRGEAIGHIAWSFMHAASVDEAIRDRFASLWDFRVEHVLSHPDDREELNGFYWFVKSKKFDVDWWLPRLKRAAELDPQLAGERGMIGKEIASAADNDPRTAFDVLKLLLDGRDEAGMAVYDLTTNAVPMILARAITSDDDELMGEAKAYMNRLGEKGNLHLEAEVLNVINGNITQSDIAD